MQHLRCAGRLPSGAIEEGRTHCMGADRRAEEHSAMVPVSPREEPEGTPETCSICLDMLEDDVVRLRQCTHRFHKECMVPMLQRKALGPLKCPMCNTIQVHAHGPCPEGDMRWRVYKPSRHPGPVAGYETHGTIAVHYRIHDGIQSTGHPLPGHPFRGTMRAAYLPNNREGRIVLKLLEDSFSRGLTFAVGHSLTTGRSNVVIWNGVHHKTSTRGGVEMHGYPDPTYLERVQNELEAQGVVPSAELLADPWIEETDYDAAESLASDDEAVHSTQSAEEHSDEDEDEEGEDDEGSESSSEGDESPAVPDSPPPQEQGNAGHPRRADGGLGDRASADVKRCREC
eukprot:Polyplicarium_translucidae@DN2904_c0_g1_i5.p1